MKQTTLIVKREPAAAQSPKENSKQKAASFFSSLVPGNQGLGRRDAGRPRSRRREELGVEGPIDQMHPDQSRDTRAQQHGVQKLEVPVGVKDGDRKQRAVSCSEPCRGGHGLHEVLTIQRTKFSSKIGRASCRERV